MSGRNKKTRLQFFVCWTWRISSLVAHHSPTHSNFNQLLESLSSSPTSSLMSNMITLTEPNCALSQINMHTRGDRTSMQRAEYQFICGQLFANGYEVPQSWSIAFGWYKMAALQQHMHAQYELACLYAKGRGVAQCWDKAFEWFSCAAKQGYPPAERNLGLCYASGHGRPKCVQKAMQWLLRATAHGDETAEQLLVNSFAKKHGTAQVQYQLGELYRMGRGVTKNMSQAAKWFYRAAQKGFTEAQFRLGLCLEKGEGVPQNWAESVKWYTLAAEKGHANAQYCLACQYWIGNNGVGKDFWRSVHFFQKASMQGFAPATAWLRECLVVRQPS